MPSHVKKFAFGVELQELIVWKNDKSQTDEEEK